MSGAVSSSGALSGLAIPAQRRRTFKWSHELATNIGPEYAEDDTLADQCLDRFVDGARTVSGTLDVSPRGMYYAVNLDQYTGTTPSTALPSTWDSGSVEFAKTSNPSQYVFCNVPDPLPTPSREQESNTTYFDISITLQTATAPSWES
jgi:hypothetical protein